MRKMPPAPELPFRHLGDPLYSQRNPHQIFLLAFSVIAAIGLLEGATGSVVLDDALPGFSIVAWGLFLLLGSSTALFGMWLPRTYSGLVVERAGLAGVSIAALGYSWLVYRAAPDAAFTALTHTAYGLSCAWRVKQINARLRWVREQAARLNEGTGDVGQ